MGYADRDYSYSMGGGSEGGFGGGLMGSVTPWVLRLLIANGAIWLLNAVGLIPLGWTAEHFGFSPGSVLTHPWTPLTYMFVHGGFWHVFMNMIVLFFFGPPLERKWGSREFMKFYLVAGMGGALISLAFLPLPMVASETLVVGASGAVYGVMLAFALNWPDARVYIWGILPIRAKWFVAGLAVITFVSTFSATGGNVAHWAHLGGLVTGFIYLRYGQRLSRQLDRLVEAAERAVPWEVRDDASPSAGRRPRPGGGAARAPGAGDGKEIRFRRRGGQGEEKPDADTLDEVDRILDKIREHGLDSLTEEEREFLDEMSRRYRG